MYIHRTTCIMPCEAVLMCGCTHFIPPQTLYSDASEPQTASTVPFVPFNVNLLSGPPPTSTDLAPPTSTDPAPPTSTDPAPPPSTDPAPPPASSTDHHWALPANAVEQHLAEFEDWALSDTPPEPFSSGDLLLPDVSTAPPSRVQPDTSTTTGGDGFDALDPLENHLGNPSGSSTNSDDWAGPNTRQTPPSFSSEPQQDRPASNSNLNPQTSSGERIEQWSPSPPLSQVSGRPRSQVEQGAPPTGGSAGRHNTPSPPGGAAEAELQVRNESLQRGLDSLQNELKLANDVRLKLQNEMIAVQEREKAVQEQLNERDHKHAEHIARITEQLSRQQDSGLDPDEREAHNIKMIKDKLQEMHKAEVERARVKHESEKTKILQDCQSRLEKYRLDSEQQANATIREMHAQFMSSNQALLQQKTASDELSTQLAAKVDSMQSQIDGFQHDQASLKKHYESALETRIQEILKLQHESKELEKRSENWRLKSVDIEAKFEQEVAAWDQQNQENEEATQKMKSQFEEKIFQLTSDVEDYQFRLQTSEMDRERVIEETRERFGKELAQIKSQHTVEVEALNRQIQVAETTKQKVIEDTKKRFDEELRKLRNQHASEVDILEESLTESGSDKASLELAEQHMRSVQTQLDAYRTQERNFQSKISEMERAHATDMEQLQQQIEASKASEIGSLIEKYDSRITALQGRLEAGESDSHSQSQEAIETLSVQHQKELLEVQTSLHESHELALTSLRKELELVNFRQLEALHDEHTRELDTLRSELEQHWRAEVERSKEQLSRELLASQEVDTQRLEASHQQVLKELRHSHLTQSGGDSTEARLAAVTGELEELKAEKERAQKDLLSQLELVQRQLQESHKKLADSKAEFTRLEGERHKYFTEGKSLAVDLSIECSAHEQDKEALAATQQEVVQLKAKCAYLQSEVSELEVAEKTSLEQSQKILELMDQLAAKNVSLTDLKVQNDALNTEVFALTQQCQKHVSASNALKKQLESSWGANEELSLLKKQLSELAPLKEDYTRIRGEVVSLASALKSKDEETAIIQTKLDESTREVSEFEQLAVKYQKAAETSALDLEALKQELSVLTQLEGELKREGHEYRARLDAMASNEAENKQTIEQLHRTVKNLQSELQSSTNHVAKLRQDKLKLEQDLLDSQGILDELATDDPELQQSYDHLQQDFEHLQSEKTQLAVELGDVRKEQERVLNEQQSSWQEQAREQERIIQELRAQVSAKEEAFTEIQSEFGRQLSEAEQREKSLRDTLQQMRESQTQLGSVVGEKTALETNLSSARQVLTEKLQEKATLENELSFHRCELERRLVEKQRLEELLFEKSRFELELKNQKDQLKTELDTIDSKLKLKELEVERERSEWQEMVQAKDSALQSQGAEFQRETAWLHQDHTHQLQQLREDFTTQHSSDLAQLSSSLNREHDLRLSSLASSLEQRHKKEVI